MSTFYYTKNYSSQEDDDNFLMSEEDSYLENDLNSKGRLSVDKASIEYKKRREKNNEAVRRSREKAKIKYSQKEQQITRLRAENKKLESEAASLKKELSIYRDIAKGMDLLVEESTTLNNNNNNNNIPIKIEKDYMGY